MRILFLALSLMGCVLAAGAQVHEQVDGHFADMLKIEKATPDPKLKIQSVTGFPKKSTQVTNRAKTFRAYVLCIPNPSDSACSSRVFFTASRSKDTFMILGEAPEIEVMRPIDGLKWLDNERLSYERWTNPHFGHRYVINVKAKKQTAAYLLSDAPARRERVQQE